MTSSAAFRGSRSSTPTRAAAEWPARSATSSNTTRSPGSSASSAPLPGRPRLGRGDRRGRPRPLLPAPVASFHRPRWSPPGHLPSRARESSEGHENFRRVPSHDRLSNALAARPFADGPDRGGRPAYRSRRGARGSRADRPEDQRPGRARNALDEIRGLDRRGLPRLASSVRREARVAAGPPRGAFALGLDARTLSRARRPHPRGAGDVSGGGRTAAHVSALAARGYGETPRHRRRPWAWRFRLRLRGRPRRLAREEEGDRGEPL